MAKLHAVPAQGCLYLPDPEQSRDLLGQRPTVLIRKDDLICFRISVGSDLCETKSDYLGLEAGMGATIEGNM